MVLVSSVTLVWETCLGGLLGSLRLTWWLSVFEKGAYRNRSAYDA